MKSGMKKTEIIEELKRAVTGKTRKKENHVFFPLICIRVYERRNDGTGKCAAAGPDF